MEINRCSWSTGDPLMVRYHDEEWGIPVHDDEKWFELIVLDTFQAGLSWKTILHKREGFRVAFDNFDYHKIAAYSPMDVARLLNDKEIIRNRLKISGTISNAKAFIKVQEEFQSFNSYIWQFTGGRQVINNWAHVGSVPASTPLSDLVSNDMKKRGFKFVGTIIVYAFLQAGGIIDDHVVTCFRRLASLASEGG